MTESMPMTRRRTRLARLGGALLGLVLMACAAQNSPTASGVAGLATAGMAVESSPDLNSALGDYLAGNFALDRGQLSEAANYFESALAGDPGNLDLMQQLFLLNLANGRYDAALKEAKPLAERDPGADEARLLLALERVRANDFAGARGPLGELGDNGIAGLTAPFLDAWAVFGQGGPSATADALKRLERGESLGPLNAYHKAMLLDLGGRTEDAAKTMSEAMPGGPAPVRIIQAYASILARAGQRDAAIAMVRGQVEDDRELPMLLDLLATLERGAVPQPPFTDAAGGMADALLGIAEALHQERGTARAIVYARLAIYLRPDLAEGSLLIGDILAEQDNLDGAIEAFDAVPPDSPLAYTAKLRTARVLHDLKRPEDAYKALEDLADREPTRIEALVQLGDLLRRDEKYDRAEAAYSRAIARIAEPKREHWTLFYARGITYERTKRWPQAEADFQHALKLEPEQPFVLNYLGYSWVDMGMHLDQAKAMLNRAAELKPNDGYIVDSLGWAHFRLGEYDQAVDQLERAVELEPGDPVINEHLGDAYWRVGREREARFQWQRALTLEPEESAVATLEQKLKSGLPEPEQNRGRT
jgi:tetratricopeptide (TPR) repeat protein